MHDFRILEAITQDAHCVAKLHKQEISKGFLSSLPDKYLVRIYEYIINQECVFIVKKEKNIVGYVALANNTSRLFKSFIKSNIIFFSPLFIQKLFTPLFFKKILETIFNSQKKNDNKCDISLEFPELLSIVVDNKYHQYGLGSSLLKKLESFLKLNNIKKYKVIAGEKLIGANKFYQRQHFELVSTVTIHNNEISNIYVKSLIG